MTGDDAMVDGLPLGLTQDPGNDELLRQLTILELYDFREVRLNCKVRTKWDDPRIEAAEYGIKLMFALELLDPGWFHIPGDDPDEYWHGMILHTGWYTSFCEAVLGRYHHHTPNLRGEALEFEVGRSLALYDDLFGLKMAGPHRPPVVRPLNWGEIPKMLMPSREFRTGLQARLARRLP